MLQPRHIVIAVAFISSIVATEWETRDPSVYGKLVPTNKLRLKRVIEKGAEGLRKDTNPGNFSWCGPDAKVDYCGPVRDQGKCGCCWATAVAGAVEAVANIRSADGTFNTTESKVVLSEQAMLNCVHRCLGCCGGLPQLAMDSMPSIPSRSAVPFNDGGTVCNGEYKYQSCEEKPTAVTIRGYTPFTGKYDEIVRRVDESGPLVASIYASPLESYKGGVLETTKCPPQNVLTDHTVVVVGHGVNPAGKKYLVVKNSWGEGWGYGGYGYVGADCLWGMGGNDDGMLETTMSVDIGSVKAVSASSHAAISWAGGLVLALLAALLS